MEPETELNILRALNSQNRWWTTGNVPENLLKPFKRRDFFVIKEKIESNEENILSLMGPRQVGKTVIMHQVIDAFIKEGTNPKNILYASFDYPYLSTISETPINDVLELYATRILRKTFDVLDERVFIFFDEICKIQEWSNILKGWYDLRYPIKFMITDSSISQVLMGSSESLVGRISPQIMLSIKFSDFVNYHGNVPLIQERIRTFSWDSRRFLKSAVRDNNLNELYEYLKNSFADFSSVERELLIHLNSYVLKNGYPEMLDLDNLQSCAEKLRNYLHLTLYKDIYRIFEVRNPKVLEELCILLSQASGQLSEYTSLSNTLDVKRETLIKYLGYLKSALLISTSEMYTTNRAKRIRKAKKIYFLNIGLRNALLDLLDERLLSDEAEMGKVIETVAYDHCMRLKFCLEPGPHTTLFYWRDSQGHEVDIIMELLGKPIPIEIKYRNKIDKKDLKGIENFLNQYPGTFGIVITKDLLQLKENILYVPLWLFLLLC